MINLNNYHPPLEVVRAAVDDFLDSFRLYPSTVKNPRKGAKSPNFLLRRAKKYLMEHFTPSLPSYFLTFDKMRERMEDLTVIIPKGYCRRFGKRIVSYSSFEGLETILSRKSMKKETVVVVEVHSHSHILKEISELPFAKRKKKRRTPPRCLADSFLLADVSGTFLQRNEFSMGEFDIDFLIAKGISSYGGEILIGPRFRGWSADAIQNEDPIGVIASSETLRAHETIGFDLIKEKEKGLCQYVFHRLAQDRRIVCSPCLEEQTNFIDIQILNITPVTPPLAIAKELARKGILVGFSETEIKVSFSFLNTRNEIDTFIEELKNLLTEVL